MPLSPGEILNNRYRIVKLLGQGGFGAVYRAWDVNLQKPCAVKENLDPSPSASRQFEREARLLSTLTHPNLPRVTDYFIFPNQGQYLVMDFVEGEDLGVRLERTNGPLPVGEVLGWATQVCKALIYLHTQNPPVIHRDIKPANIRITPAGTAMLVDFGIAKLYDPHLKTTLGARAVTPGYSPPEQYGRGITNAQSDVYALGATLYHLLSGQEPPSAMEVVSEVVAPARQVSELNPAVPLTVSQAISKALSIPRSER